MNNPKKITLNTIGLIIVPNNKPNRIQSLFKGSRTTDLKSATTRNKTLNTANKYDAVANPSRWKYAPATKNILLKKKPNFRLDGSSILDKFTFFLTHMYEKVAVSS